MCPGSAHRAASAGAARARVIDGSGRGRFGGADGLSRAHRSASDTHELWDLIPQEVRPEDWAERGSQRGKATKPVDSQSNGGVVLKSSNRRTY